MEDEYVIGNKSNFFGVFDGHGGKKVSAYLRQHILVEYEKNLLRHLESNKTKGNGALSRLDCIEMALVESLENVQKQVLGSREMYRQGSTVVIVVIEDGHLITANIGKI
jgi:serine/threonine protein phosphatase PrpC